MTLEECNGNWNFMYEFRIGKNWYPCNVIKVNNGRVCIFTRNGSVTSEQYKDVRKMDKDLYLQLRSEIIRNLGKYAYDHGYHNNIEDDLMLLRDSKELNVMEIGV